MMGECYSEQNSFCSPRSKNISMFRHQIDLEIDANNKVKTSVKSSSCEPWQYRAEGFETGFWDG